MHLIWWITTSFFRVLEVNSFAYNFRSCYVLQAMIPSDGKSPSINNEAELGGSKFCLLCFQCLFSVICILFQTGKTLLKDSLWTSTIMTCLASYLLKSASWNLTFMTDFQDECRYHFVCNWKLWIPGLLIISPCCYSLLLGLSVKNVNGCIKLLR